MTIEKVNQANKKTGGKLIEIMKKLQELRKFENTDKEINEVIQGLKLPLGLHLFITGNYSFLMGLKY